MIAAVILAAGRSTRMGRPKQILPIRGRPMLQEVLGIFRRTRVGRVVVVLGANARKVRHSVDFQQEVVVLNRRFAEGMGSSLRIGLASIGDDADAVIVALGDQPLLSPATVNRVIEAYLNSRARVVVPVFNGRRGHPDLFDKVLFPQIMNVQGDAGAREVVEKCRRGLLEVAVEDEGVLVDIDTPADYEDVALQGRPSKRWKGVKEAISRP